MSVDRRIRRHFNASSTLVQAGIVGEARAKEEFSKGYSLLKKSLQAQGSLTNSQFEILTPEILVLCAETAIKNGKFDVAHDCSELYFLRDPPQDQFFCRALFIRAQVQAFNSGSATGQDAVNRLEVSIGHILHSIEIALSPSKFPRYNFIIYNASVHYWNVTRRMMRAGACQYLCDSMQVVVSALEKSEERSKSWLCRYQLRLAQCFDDKGDSKRAAQCALAAHDIVQKLPEETPKIESAALQRQVRDFGIYMGRVKDGDCGKLSNSVLASWKSAGIVSEVCANIESIVQQCKSGAIAEPAKIQSALEDALSQLLDKKNAASQSQDDDAPTVRGSGLSSSELDCLAQISFEAVRHKLMSVADKALAAIDRVKQRPPTADVVVGYAKALFVVETFGQSYAPQHCAHIVKAVPPQLPQTKYRALGLARRLEAIKMLERALLTCQRLRKPDLLQEGCVLAWNLGLPLLTPRMRKYTHRLFSAAVKYLDDIASPLVGLRARLHFEIAKFEVASDFLTKALDHVNDALALDYGQISTEVIDTPEFDITDDLAKKVAADKCRPLDHHLHEIKNKLTLRASLYNQPSEPLQKALMLVEQAKGAKDDTFRSTVLTNAAKVLGLAEEAASNSPTSSESVDPQDQKAISDGESDDLGAATVDELHRTIACSDIMTLLWQTGETKVATRAAQYVVRRKWHPEQFRNVVFVQTQACLTLADMSLASLAALFEKLEEEAQLAAQASGADSPTLTIPDHEKLPGSRTGPEKSLALKRKLVERLSDALQYARSCESKAPWLVQNVAKHIWNHHFGVCVDVFDNNTDRLLPELVQLLRDTLEALFSTASNDVGLLCNISRLLAKQAVLNGDFANAIAVCNRIQDLQHPPELTFDVLSLRAIAQVSDPKSGGKAVAIFNQQSHWKSKIIAAIAMLNTPSPTNPAESALDHQTANQLWTLAFQCLHENAASSLSELSAAATTTYEHRQLAEALTVRLWAEIALSGLKLGELEKVQIGCYEASALLPDDQASRAKLSRSFWRYMAMVECTWGRAVTALIRGESQSDEVKAKLRQAALPHLVLAARWSNLAGDAALLVSCIGYFLEVSGPFLHSAATREKNFGPATRIMQEFISATSHGTSGETMSDADWTLIVNTYLTILAVHKDRQDWVQGLQCCNEACEIIPADSQGPIWSIKVLCLSRLGKNVAAAVAKMKNSTGAAQAKMWAMLARNSASEKAQLESYMKALNCAKKSFERTEYLVEVAEWMQRKGHFSSSATFLLECIDAILDVEQNNEDSSLTNGSAQSENTAPSNSQQKSGVKSLFRQTAMVVIAAGNTDASNPARLDVGHFELAARCFTMLSLLAGTPQSRSHFASLARVQVVAMLQRAMDVVNYNVLSAKYRELTGSKAGQQELSQLAKQLHQADVPVEQWVRLQDPPFKVPVTLADWTHFKIDDALIEHWAKLSDENPVLRPFALHGHCIKRVDVVSHYMHALINILISCGKELECVPVLVVLEALVRSAQTPLTPSLYKTAAASGMASDDLVILPESSVPGVSLPLQMVLLQAAKVHSLLGNSDGAIAYRVQAGRLGLRRHQHTDHIAQLRQSMPSEAAGEDMLNDLPFGVLPRNFSVADLLLQQASLAIEAGEVDAAKLLLVDADAFLPILPTKGSGRQVLERHAAILWTAIWLHECNFELAEERMKSVFQCGRIAAKAHVPRVQQALELVFSFGIALRESHFYARLLTFLKKTLSVFINQYAATEAGRTAAGTSASKHASHFDMLLDHRIAELRCKAMSAEVCAELAWALYEQQGSVEAVTHDVTDAIAESQARLSTVLQLKADATLISHPSAVDSILQSARAHASLLSLRARVLCPEDLDRPIPRAQVIELVLSVATQRLNQDQHRAEVRYLRFRSDERSVKFLHVPTKAQQLAKCLIEAGFDAVAESEAQVQKRRTDLSGEDAHVKKWIFAIDTSRDELSRTGPAAKALRYYSDAFSLLAGGTTAGQLNTHKFAASELNLQNAMLPRRLATLLAEAACGAGRAAFDLCRLAGCLGEDESHWGGDKAVVSSAFTSEALSESSSKFKPSDLPYERLPQMTQAVISAATKAFKKDNSGHELPPGLAATIGTALQRLFFALKVAIRHDDLKSVRGVSLQLAEFFGSSNPEACAEYLLLYQHARNVLAMRRAFEKAASSSQTSTSANRSLSFLRLRAALQLRHFAPEATLAYRAATKYLHTQKPMMWSHLHVTASCLAPLPSTVAALPAGTVVVSLQHAGGAAAADSDKYDPAFDPDGDSTRGAPAQALYAAVIVDGEVAGTFRQPWRNGEASKLRSLASQYEAFTAGLGTRLVKSSGSEVDLTTELSKIQENLSAIFAPTDLIQWLRRVLPVADDASDSAESTRHLCLLLDETLDKLPMESISIFAQAGKQSTSRDFSLHTLASRVRHLQQQTSATAPGSLNVVVDPFDESKGIVEAFASLKSGKFLSSGKVLIGAQQHCPSEGEIAHTLASSSTYVHIGPERILGPVSPGSIAALNASQCKTAIILDRGVNERSNRRQMKLDSTKTKAHLNCERVTDTARLLTLSGVSTIVLSKTACTLDSLATKASSVFASIDAGGTVGQAAAAMPQKQEKDDAPDDTPEAGKCSLAVYGVSTNQLV